MSLPPTDMKGQQGDNGSHFPNSLILNQLMNQSSNSRTQQQGGMSMLGTGGGISYVPGHLSTTTTATATNNNLLAAAVQQQVMASLAAASSSQSSNFPLLHPMGQTFANGRPPNPTGLNILSFGRQTSIDSQQREQIIATEPTKNESHKGNITTTQIPCQARGMSAGHNAITAYFEIPSNAIHGQHLYCSHPTCRSAGVKFRYCLHCKKPVTKQNFRSRHLHASVNNKKPSSVAAGIRKLKEENSKKKVVKPEVSTQNKRPPLSSSMMPSGPTPALDHTIHPAPTKEEEWKVDVTKKRKEFTTSASSSPLSPSGFDPALTVVARRRRWSSLLRERPVELSSINGWLSQVIAVCDPNIPINFTEESLLLNHGTTDGRTSIAQQAAWDGLLTQRPENVSTSAPTEWLVKVLTISCPGYSEAAKNTPDGGVAMMVGELATKNVGLPPHDILRRPVTADTATTSPKRAKTS